MASAPTDFTLVPDFRELVESTADAIYVIDLEGRFVYLNQGGLDAFGYTEDELLGRRFETIVTDASKPVAVAHFLACIQETEHAPFFEVDIYRSDGTTARVEVRANGLHRDGAVIGCHGVCRDISLLKSAPADVADNSERLTLLDNRAPADVPSPEELGLAPVDVEILRLLATGASNAEIGGEVFLSPHTVKDHVAKLMRALGARRRADLVLEAARRGLLT
jgi:PAS domain S-box-containing protein